MNLFKNFIRVCFCAGTLSNLYAEMPAWKLKNVLVAPPSRLLHTLNYDPISRHSMTWGGMDFMWDGKPWLWNGIQWTRSESIGPNPRWLHQIVTDSTRGEFYLFGGTVQGPLGYLDFSDLWSIAPQGSWQRIDSIYSPGTRIPAPRAAHAMVYDSDRDRLVLFGGFSFQANHMFGDTWEYDLRYHKWELVDSYDPNSPHSPKPRRSSIMLYDPFSKQSILYGGDDDTNHQNGFLSDTWAWDGKTKKWTQLASAGPTPRLYSSAAFDSRRDIIILFGGMRPNSTLLKDTWIYRPNHPWQQITTSDAPWQRYGHAMTYDYARDRVLLYGGADDIQGDRSDTWEFNWPVPAAN